MKQAAHGFDVFITNHSCYCTYCDSYRESVKKLISSFSRIPTRWTKQIDPNIFWTPMWETVFVPTHPVDVRSIEELLLPMNEESMDETPGWAMVADTGILAIECDGELILGIDGAGYDFYTDHWTKLYDALGYSWHTPVVCEKQSSV